MQKGLRKAVLLLFIPVIWFLISDAVFTVNTSALKPADLIIVFGYPVNNDGSISPTQKSRVEEGINLYKNGLANKILFTGGAVANHFVEAEIMKQYAQTKNVPEADILTETQSINTIQNAFYSKHIIQSLQANNLILVTSSYHTLRASYVFKPYANNIQMKAVHYPKKFGFLGRLKAMLYEYAAWLYYLIYGWETEKNRTGILDSQRTFL